MDLTPALAKQKLGPITAEEFALTANDTTLRPLQTVEQIFKNIEKTFPHYVTDAFFLDRYHQDGDIL